MFKLFMMMLMIVSLGNRGLVKKLLEKINQFRAGSVPYPWTAGIHPEVFPSPPS